MVRKHGPRAMLWYLKSTANIGKEADMSIAGSI